MKQVDTSESFENFAPKVSLIVTFQGRHVLLYHTVCSILLLLLFQLQFGILLHHQDDKGESGNYISVDDIVIVES